MFDSLVFSTLQSTNYLIVLFVLSRCSAEVDSSTALSVLCSNQLLPRGLLGPTKILVNDMTHTNDTMDQWWWPNFFFFFFFFAFNRYFPLTLDWNYVLCFMFLLKIVILIMNLTQPISNG